MTHFSPSIVNNNSQQHLVIINKGENINYINGKDFCFNIKSIKSPDNKVYTMNGSLGKGSFGTVYKVDESGKRYAMKISKDDEESYAQLQCEADFLIKVIFFPFKQFA